MNPNQQDYQNMMLLDNYAPADFPDSEDTRPAETYLETGSQVPATVYSSAFFNALQVQVRDSRERAHSIAQVSNNWKRKIRDIFQRGNENIFHFLHKPVSAHPTIGHAEAFIRKFSRPEVQAKNASTFLRDVLEDISGDIYKSEIDARLAAKSGEGPMQTLVLQARELYEIYRETTEKIGQVEAGLKAKVFTLDKIQPRLIMLMDLGVNEETEALQAHIDQYLKKIYDANCPEVEYKELLGLYKKLLILRDLMQLLKVYETNDKEPLCSICLNEQVQYAVSPCGHTFCEGCVRKQTVQCFMCRGNIHSRVKMFFC